MGLTISLNRVSFLPPVRNNIFYEIETSSTGLYNTGLGRSPFWRKTFKNDEKFGFGSPYLPLLLRKSGSAPDLHWKKIIGPYIWVNIVLKKNIGLRPKLGNTYYYIMVKCFQGRRYFLYFYFCQKGPYKHNWHKLVKFHTNYIHYREITL